MRLYIDVDPFMEVYAPARIRLMHSAPTGIAGGGAGDMPTFKTGTDATSVTLICSAILTIMDAPVRAPGTSITLQNNQEQQQRGGENINACEGSGLTAGHAELVLQALRVFHSLITFGHLTIQDAFCGKVRWCPTSHSAVPYRRIFSSLSQ